jgi:energy-coupling factor transporter ATP-binding protein EcfA2
MTIDSQPLAAASFKTETSIWSELDTWAGTLPEWQRHILQHAVRNGSLSPDELDEAYERFLTESGLDESSTILEKIEARISARDAEVDPLVIIGIENLVNVNAIPHGTVLPFGRHLTVIYGRNGSGKTGFFRILAASCFSRGRYKILPDVFENSEKKSVSADIKLLVKDCPETLTFSPGLEFNQLKRISVFDSNVAKIHLTQENALGFQPAGFDVFEELTRAVQYFARRVDEQIIIRTASTKLNTLFLENSSVAEFVERIGPTTAEDDVVAYGHFGATEADRLDELNRQIAEINATGGEETLKALKQSISDISEAETSCEKCEVALNADVCSNLSKMFTEFARLMAQAATDAIPNHERHSEWVDYFKCSHVLGTQVASDYPQIGYDCLLCRRPLDEAATSAIRKFWSLISDKFRIHAEQLSLQIDKIVEGVRAAEPCLLKEGSRIRASLAKQTPKALEILDKFSEKLTIRKVDICSAAEAFDCTKLPSDALLIQYDLLEQLKADLQSQISLIEAGDIATVLRSLASERVELRHRQVLSSNMDAVISHLKALKWIDTANKVKRRNLNTRPITDKQRELFSKVIEGKYRHKLEDECRALKCELPIKLIARGDAGRTLRRISLDNEYRPEEVFSEGEQRALALADFLTEAGMNPSSAAIVLDDPVTSLDHHRKEAIAIRLAEEASQRQVIVFTHDLVFYSLLTTEAEARSIDVSSHWIDRSAGKPGKVVTDTPPLNSKAFRTLHRAKESLARAKKATGEDRVQQIFKCAAEIRYTLEETIISRVFAGTVQRWDEQIRVGNLNKVQWTESIASDCIAIHGKVSRFIEAHSHSDEHSGGMPDTSEIETILTKTEALIASLK